MLLTGYRCLELLDGIQVLVQLSGDSLVVKTLSRPSPVPLRSLRAAAPAGHRSHLGAHLREEGQFDHTASPVITSPECSSGQLTMTPLCPLPDGFPVPEQHPGRNQTLLRRPGL